MRQTFVGCKTSHKSSAYRIKNKIQEMFDRNEIESLSSGWNHLTDILRASITCHTAKEIGMVLKKFDETERVKIMRIKPRFDRPSGPVQGTPKSLNDVIVNFEYYGKMICEF